MQANKKIQTTLQAVLGLAVVVLLNIVANSRMSGRPLYGALDLTEEKRFTLTPGTRAMLEQQEDVVFIRVLLAGDKYPAGFKRLQEATREMLEDFRGTALLSTNFTTQPGTATRSTSGGKKYKEDGILPVNLRVKGTDETSITSIFPYAIVFRASNRRWSIFWKTRYRRTQRRDP
ncbi:MAG: Gldg family protein [Saprospiraceae bacterium]